MILASLLAQALLLLLSPTVEAPTIGLGAQLQIVGFDADGAMAVPDDVSEVGLWEFGPPGHDGNFVLAGHVSAPGVKGAFYALKDLEPGDPITVADGKWVVTSVITYSKVELPVEDIFIGDGGSPELVLVTCGGAFNQTLRSFDSNIVVYAQPVSTSS